MYSILHKIFMNSAAVYYIIMSWYTWIYLHTIYLIIIKDCLYQKLCCFVFFDTWTKKTHPVPVSSSDKKSMPPPHCSHLVSVPLPVFKFFFIVKRLYINVSCHVWLQQSIQVVTLGSRTEGLGKMGNLSANIVCLYTVTLREGHSLCLCEAETTG